MYIYIYICMCVYIYMYIHICIHIYTCRCRYIHIRISYIPTIFWPWRCLAKSSGATPSNTLQSCSTWHLITRLSTQQRTKSWRMSDGTGWGGWGERKDTEKCESKLHAAPSHIWLMHTHTHTRTHKPTRTLCLWVCVFAFVYLSVCLSVWIYVCVRMYLYHW